MAGELFGGQSRLAKVIISRTGATVEIQRSDGTEATNDRGKVTDTDVTYEKVADETARRIYNTSNDRPDYAGVMGGRVSVDAPRVAFFEDTEAEEDDRVVFPDGATYQLDEKIPMDTHVEFRSTLIT